MLLKAVNPRQILPIQEPCKEMHQGSLYIYIYIYILDKCVKCSPMPRETGVQSKVESYQRLKNSTWYSQDYKVRIKGKVEQSREKSSALISTSVLLLLKREPSGRQLY